MQSYALFCMRTTFPRFFLLSCYNLLPLQRSLKHSGALLGSNLMRNKTAQNDKYGQGSLSMRPLHFTSILRVSAHAKKNPSIAWTCHVLYPCSCNLSLDCLFPVALPFPLQLSCAECRLGWRLPVQAHVRTLVVIEVDSGLQSLLHLFYGEEGHAH